MLVITRKEGEKIIIADDIEITVCHVGAGRVRLGVIAPPHVKILRVELRDLENRVHDGCGESPTAS